MGILDRNAIAEKIEAGERAERRALRKKQKEKFRKDRIGFWNDFKKFITKGNVLDLAVAVVIANAFNAIVNGLVKYIITPAVTYATSGVSIHEWEYIIREETLAADGTVELAKISIQYGLWLQTILDFLIIAFSIFVAVRIIRSTERRLKAKELAKKEAEEAQKKVEEAQKALQLQEQADAEKAARDEFYANVREQSILLRDIREALKK